MRCGACDVRFDAPLADAMHITRLPEQRAAILERRFQVFTCPACSVETHVESDMVYTDFERWHYVAVVARAPSLAAVQEHMRVFDDTFTRGPAQAQAFGARMRKRVVFGHEALREKLVLWDAGLDDAAVEQAKRAAQSRLGLPPGEELWRVTTVLPGGHALIARLAPGIAADGSRADRLIGHTTITAAEITGAGSPAEAWLVDAHDGARMGG